MTLNDTGTLRVSAAPVATLSGFGGNGNSFPGSNTSYTANGWTVNSAGISSGPFPSTDVLQLTDNGGGEARGAFYNTPVPYQSARAASPRRLPTPPAETSAQTESRSSCRTIAAARPPLAAAADPSATARAARSRQASQRSLISMAASASASTPRRPPTAPYPAPRPSCRSLSIAAIRSTSP